MKKLKSIVSIFLVVVMLITSVGCYVRFHFCGGKIENMDFYGKVTHCVKQNISCHHDVEIQNQSLSERNRCCEDIVLIANIDKAPCKIVAKNTVTSFQNIVIPVVGFFQSAYFFPARHSPKIKYTPPLIDQDITIRDQTFRI